MTDVYAALLALVVGWLLNELGQSIRNRREDLRPIRRALSELLEIHHQVWGLQQLFATIQQQFGLTDSDLLQVRPQILAAMPQIKTVHARYLEAVSDVAAVDPLLAFQLRHKDIVAELDNLGDSFINDPSQLSFWAAMERTTLEHSKKPFEESLRAVGRRCGLRTSLAVRRYLRKPIASDRGFATVMEQVFAAVQAASEAERPEV